MVKIEKLFKQTNLGWGSIFRISIACGIIPGLLMIPEILDRTSFQQPCVTFEFWICMAMYIILNSKKPGEAALKTFVFFLISQPLIYLVQVPFSWMHWQIFQYYPRWGFLTICTIPGAMIAWLTKKEKWYSALIWCVAALIICMCLAPCLIRVITDFPLCLLAVVFMLAELIIFPAILFKKKQLRIISYIISALMLTAFTIYEYNSYLASLKFMVQ